MGLLKHSHRIRLLRSPNQEPERLLPHRVQLRPEELHQLRAVEHGMRRRAPPRRAAQRRHLLLGRIAGGAPWWWPGHLYNLVPPARSDTDTINHYRNICAGLWIHGESCLRAEGGGGGQEQVRQTAAELQVAGICGAHDGRPG